MKSNNNLTFGVKETTPSFGISDVGGFIAFTINEANDPYQSRALTEALLASKPAETVKIRAYKGQVKRARNIVLHHLNSQLDDGRLHNAVNVVGHALKLIAAS